MNKPKPVLTPIGTFFFRATLIVILVPLMIWNVGKTAARELGSFCKYTFYFEPRIVWEEWIAAFRRGQP